MIEVGLLTLTLVFLVLHLVTTYMVKERMEVVETALEFALDKLAEVDARTAPKPKLVVPGVPKRRWEGEWDFGFRG